jgi:hypothetical protein
MVSLSYPMLFFKLNAVKWPNGIADICPVNMTYRVKENWNDR